MDSLLSVFGRRAVGVMVAVGLVGFATPSGAWNKPGHMVTGALAYDDLFSRGDNAVIAKVIALLKRNPHFTVPLGEQKSWQSQIQDLSPGEQRRALFMLAARFADDARSDPTLHHGAWHYINIPFRPAGQPASVPAPQPTGQTILTAFEKNLNIVKNRTLSARERSIALCWLFHLVGDAHQPLHSVALFTTVFPQGDRGGNDFFVRPALMSDTVNLHSFWDDIVIPNRNDDFATVGRRAVTLRTQEAPRISQTEIAVHPDFRQWVQIESFALAKRDSYVFNGTLLKSGTEQTGEVLPDGYAKHAGAIAIKRVGLAGYRLADLLRSLKDTL